MKLVIYKHNNDTNHKHTYSPYDTKIFDNHNDATVALDAVAKANPKHKFALMNMQGGFVIDERG